MPTPPLVCSSCRSPLQDHEVGMYEGVCNFCATTDWDRIRAWRAGKDDPELDERYGRLKRRFLN